MAYAKALLVLACALAVSAQDILNTPLVSKVNNELNAASQAVLGKPLKGVPPPPPAPVPAPEPSEPSPAPAPAPLVPAPAPTPEPTKLGKAILTVLIQLEDGEVITPEDEATITALLQARIGNLGTVQIQVTTGRKLLSITGVLGINITLVTDCNALTINIQDYFKFYFVKEVRAKGILIISASLRGQCFDGEGGPASFIQATSENVAPTPGK